MLIELGRIELLTKVVEKGVKLVIPKAVRDEVKEIESFLPNIEEFLDVPPKASVDMEVQLLGLHEGEKDCIRSALHIICVTK